MFHITYVEHKLQVLEEHKVLILLACHGCRRVWRRKRNVSVLDFDDRMLEYVLQKLTAVVFFLCHI